MKSNKLSFTNPQGVSLVARLDVPVAGEPIAYALFAHCFTCSKDLKAVANISRSLNREQIAVLRFDFTGLGESQGDFSDTTFLSNVSDLMAAAEMLSDRYQAPAILIGHSLGGAAVLQAAGQIPSVRAVATIAAPADPGHVAHLFKEQQPEIEAQGAAEVNLAGRRFTIKKPFLDALESTEMVNTIGNLRKALLVLHGPLDNTVSIDHAARIFQAAKHPKSFISLDRADHLLSNTDDSRYAGMVIAAWARRYIQSVDPTDSLPPGDNRVMARVGSSGFLTEINANGHNMVADEPTSVGGTNLGPTPYDYLVAGLGACTAMTLRMYADRKKWPVEAIRVRLTHQKIHAVDCKECETATGKIDHIHREIDIKGDLDVHQRRRMVEIADKCPVHRTLEGEIRVTTKGLK